MEDLPPPYPGPKSHNDGGRHPTVRFPPSHQSSVHSPDQEAKNHIYPPTKIGRPRCGNELPHAPTPHNHRRYRFAFAIKLTTPLARSTVVRAGHTHQDQPQQFTVDPRLPRLRHASTVCRASVGRCRKTFVPIIPRHGGPQRSRKPSRL